MVYNPNPNEYGSYTSVKTCPYAEHILKPYWLFILYPSLLGHIAEDADVLTLKRGLPSSTIVSQNYPLQRQRTSDHNY